MNKNFEWKKSKKSFTVLRNVSVNFLKNFVKILIRLVARSIVVTDQFLFRFSFVKLCILAYHMWNFYEFKVKIFYKYLRIRMCKPNLYYYTISL